MKSKPYTLPSVKPIKKPNLTKAKARAWGAFSIYIRLRDALRYSGDPRICQCISCGKEYPSFGLGCLQAGHYVPGRGSGILFDDRGCFSQCYNCNVRLKGNHVRFRLALEKRISIEAITEMEKAQNNTLHPKWFDLWGVFLFLVSDIERTWEKYCMYGGKCFKTDHLYHGNLLLKYIRKEGISEVSRHI